MAVQVQFNLRQDTLEVIYSGVVEGKRQKDAELMRLVREVQRCKVEKLLIEHTRLVCNLNTMDIYDGMNYIAEGSMPRLRVLALVTPTRHRDDARFAADVAANRGLEAESFDDRESAQAWLSNV